MHRKLQRQLICNWRKVDLQADKQPRGLLEPRRICHWDKCCSLEFAPALWRQALSGSPALIEGTEQLTVRPMSQWRNHTCKTVAPLFLSSVREKECLYSEARLCMYNASWQLHTSLTVDLEPLECARFCCQNFYTSNFSRPWHRREHTVATSGGLHLGGEVVEDNSKGFLGCWPTGGPSSQRTLATAICAYALEMCHYSCHLMPQA